MVLQRMRTMALHSDQPEFKFGLCSFLAGCPWAGDWYSLSFCILGWNAEKIKAPPQRVAGGWDGDHTCAGPSTETIIPAAPRQLVCCSLPALACTSVHLGKFECLLCTTCCALPWAPRNEANEVTILEPMRSLCVKMSRTGFLAPWLDVYEEQLP